MMLAGEVPRAIHPRWHACSAVRYRWKAARASKRLNEMGEHKFRMADGETGSDLRAKGLMALPRRYGLAGVFRMAVSLLATKVISRDARLIRLPVYIRNRRLIRFGPGFTSGVGLRIEALDERSDRPLIEIGPNVQVNDYVHIGAVHSVRLGAN